MKKTSKSRDDIAKLIVVVASLLAFFSAQRSLVQLIFYAKFNRAQELIVPTCAMPY
jgi:hypothetical protein